MELQVCSYYWNRIYLEFKLPGVYRQSELIELEGLSKSEIRQIGIKNLFARPRTPCKLCGSSSWIVKHANRQQIVIRPVSLIGNARMKSAKIRAYVFIIFYN